MKDFGPAARHTKRIIMEWLSSISFDSVIDVSCGGGQLLAGISENFFIPDLIGTEFTDQNVSANRERFPWINFLTFDLEKDKPLEPRDLVLCIDVLEHIEDDQLALQKLRIMTKKYLFLAVPLGRVSINERFSLGHLHGYSKTSIDNLIEQANFNRIKSLLWGFPFYWFTRKLTNLFGQSPAEGKVSPGKKVLFLLLYILYKINLPIIGGRYFVLCAPREK